MRVRPALLAALLSVPGLSCGTPVQASPAHRAMTFAPPTGVPMVLTRTVVRTLKDGGQIVAHRIWRVRFVKAEDGGWLVEGTLLRSTVDAPPALAEMAEIERDRPDDMAWPLRLDSSGAIEDRDRATSDPQTIEQAIGAMKRHLPAGGSGLQDKAFIARIRAAAARPATAHWPSGLFQPGAFEHEARQDFALPDNGRGQVITRFTRDGSGPTMSSAERRVTTVIDGDAQVSTERWTLVPMPDRE